MKLRPNIKTKYSEGTAETRLASQQNWLMWEHQASATSTYTGYEYLFYTDARVIGQRESGLGPYSFLNSLPSTIGVLKVNASIVLRAEICSRVEFPDMSSTDETRYYGGETIADELAALTSLVLGIRIQTSGASREFGYSDDPLGQPLEGLNEEKPSIWRTSRIPMLPALSKECSLTKLDLLNTIPEIDSGRYINLVRACRAYQSALWIADSDANLAWLLLVAAIETAALDYRVDSNTPESMLKEIKPCLASYLEKEGGTALLSTIAQNFSHLMQSTQRFIQFGLRFLPMPPERDPDNESGQIDWSPSSMYRILKKIYSYRSRYLHSGIPFPAPMLSSRIYTLFSPLPEVAIPGLGTYSHGATWKPKDVPINLHCFHHLARGILLNWWKKSLTKTAD